VEKWTSLDGLMPTEATKLIGGQRSLGIAGSTRGGGGISIEDIFTCRPWTGAPCLVRRVERLEASFIGGGAGVVEVVEPNEALRDHEPEFVLILVKGGRGSEG